MIRIVALAAARARRSAARPRSADAQTPPTVRAQGSWSPSPATSCASATWSRMPARPPTSRSSARPTSAQTGAVPVARVARGAARRTASTGVDTGGLDRGRGHAAEPRHHRQGDRGAHRARARRPVRLRRRAATSPSPSTATSRALHVEPSATGRAACSRAATSIRAPAASTSPSSCRAAPLARRAAAALHRHRRSRPSRPRC